MASRCVGTSDRRGKQARAVGDSSWRRGIIDAVQDVYGLTDEQVDSSRAVLRRYGNLSSATMLFVLDDMRRRLQDRRSGLASGMAVAFGPGLTAEMTRITYLPSVVGQEQLIGDAR